MSNASQNPLPQKSDYSKQSAGDVKTDKKDEALTVKPAGSAKDETFPASYNKIKSSNM